MMARASSPGSAAVMDFDLQHPERHLWIGGHEVVVREYVGGEWLGVLLATRPLLDEMVGMLQIGAAPRFEDVLMMVARHQAAVMPVVAIAADVDMTDLRTSTPTELETLMMTWWGTNGAFFIKHASMRISIARTENAAAQGIATKAITPARTRRVGEVDPLPRTQGTGKRSLKQRDVRGAA